MGSLLGILVWNLCLHCPHPGRTRTAPVSFCSTHISRHYNDVVGDGGAQYIMSQRLNNFGIPPTYAQMVWPRTAKFGTIIHVGDRFSWESANTPYCGDEAPVSPNFWDPLPTPIRFDLEWPMMRNMGSTYYRVSHAILGAGPSDPNFWTICLHTVWETTTILCIRLTYLLTYLVIKLAARKVCTRSTTNADARSVSGN